MTVLEGLESCVWVWRAVCGYGELCVGMESCVWVWRGMRSESDAGRTRKKKKGGGGGYGLGYWWKKKTFYNYDSRRKISKFPRVKSFKNGKEIDLLYISFIYYTYAGAKIRARFALYTFMG